jgi:adenylylsulfate kinase-like enzyme
MTLPFGSVVWLTGLPGTGKSTLANALLDRLRAERVATLWLDSDALRPILTPQASYSDAERDFFYGALGHLAVLGAEGGVTVVASATANKRAYRDAVRARVRAFVEVHLTCAPESLRKRDIKGLYADSAAGRITNLPGRGGGYEPPLRPDLAFETDRVSPDDGARAILAHLQGLPGFSEPG